MNRRRGYAGTTALYTGSFQVSDLIGLKLNPTPLEDAVLNGIRGEMNRIQSKAVKDGLLYRI